MTPDSSSSAPPEAEEAKTDRDRPSSPDEAFALLRERFAQLIDYASYYLAAKRDTLRLAITRGILLLVTGIITVAIISSVIVTAAVLICEGVADGLSILFGHRWIGELATGALIIVAIAAIAFVGMKMAARRSLHMTLEKYEKLRQRQREQYGRDIAGASVNGDRDE